MRILRSALLVTALNIALVGCAMFGKNMTETEIQTYGTYTSNAPKAKIYDAAINALKSQGYEIAVENPESGVIKTGRKPIRAQAVSSGAGSATAVMYFRQYLLRIREVDGGKVTVTAVPRVFQGEMDLSDRAVWDLEGPIGERALWNNLFREIDEAL